MVYQKRNRIKKHASKQRNKQRNKETNKQTQQQKQQKTKPWTYHHDSSYPFIWLKRNSVTYFLVKNPTNDLLLVVSCILDFTVLKFPSLQNFSYRRASITKHLHRDCLDGVICKIPVVKQNII